MTTIYATRVKVTTKTTAGVLHLQYTYFAAGIRFSFSTLNEVGEPLQKEAKRCADRIAQQLGRVVRGKEINERPWVVDALVTQQEAEEMAEVARQKREEYLDKLYGRFV